MEIHFHLVPATNFNAATQNMENGKCVNILFALGSARPKLHTPAAAHGVAAHVAAAMSMLI